MNENDFTYDIELYGSYHTIGIRVDTSSLEIADRIIRLLNDLKGWEDPYLMALVREENGNDE